MNCQKCGVSNNIDAKFCGSCGNDLSVAPIQNTNEINQTEEVLELGSTETITPNQTNNSQILTEPTVQNNVNINNQLSSTTSQEVTPTNQNLTYQPANNQITPKANNKPRTTILIVVAIAIIVVAVILLNLYFGDEKSDKKKLDDIFNPEQLIRVKKDDKYGYIDTDGKLVIDAIYEQASEFRGGFATVRSETEIEGIKTNVYQVIDKKGNVKVQSEEKAEYIEDFQLWVIDEELYNSSMKKISSTNVRVEYEDEGYFVWVNSKENTGGIMNEKGKQTYTYKFEEDESYINIEPSETDDSLKETYCRINIENDKYAIVNCDTGAIVHDFTDKYVSVSYNNIFEITDHDTYELIKLMYIQGDKILYQSESKDIDLTYYPGYVQIRDDSKPYSERYTYLHTSTGQIESETPTDNNSAATEELDEWEELTKNKKFSCGNNYGLMNDEQVTLPCEWGTLKYLETNLYKYLKSDGKEYIYGQKDDKWYLIDLKSKKAVIEFNTSYLTTEDNTTFMYYTDSDTRNEKVYNLLSGKTLNVDSSASLTIYSNYITVKDSNSKTIKYYNVDLKLIYTEDL